MAWQSGTNGTCLTKNQGGVTNHGLGHTKTDQERVTNIAWRFGLCSCALWWHAFGDTYHFGWTTMTHTRFKRKTHTNKR
jgi:hypothetical protein